MFWSNVSALIGPYVNPVVSQAVACRVFKDLMPDLFPGMCHKHISFFSFFSIYLADFQTSSIPNLLDMNPLDP